MKKILVAILALTLMASPSLAANDGGKKKSKKKARVECTKDKCCDPRNCDSKSCDPKNCNYPPSKDVKCRPTVNCTGN